jgi:hypothetical protein
MSQRVCRANAEEELDRSRDNARTYPAASRPLQMFLYEVALRSKTLFADILMSWEPEYDRNPELHIFSPEEAVRISWKEDRIWLPEWRDRPSGSWLHETCNDAYERRREAAGYHYIHVTMPDGSKHGYWGLNIREVDFSADSSEEQASVADQEHNRDPDALALVSAQSSPPSKRAIQWRSCKATIAERRGPRKASNSPEAISSSIWSGRLRGSILQASSHNANGLSTYVAAGRPQRRAKRERHDEIVHGPSKRVKKEAQGVFTPPSKFLK